MLPQFQNSGGVNELLNTAEFILPLWDSGSGAVNTSLWRGTGSATFTRATTATTVNSAGQIISVASGVPRSYYDPTTLQYLGYLAEGARTNLCLRSQEFDNASWARVNLSVSVDSILAPNGDTSAETLTDDAVSGQHNTGCAGVTFSAATAYTFSVFLKAGTATWAQLRFDPGVPFPSGCFANFNLASGVVGTVGADASATIKAFPNGWYRCAVTSTADAGGGLYRAFVQLTNSTDAVIAVTYSGSGQSLYAWGAQLEAGSFPSTYIPTTTASVTRNADVLTYPFSGNGIDATGTVFAQIVPSGALGANAGFLQITDGTVNNQQQLQRTSAGVFLGVTVSGGVSTGVCTTATSLTPGSVSRAAYTYGANNFIACANAGTVATDVSGAVPTGLTTINVGFASGNTGWFGTLRNIRIWQTQFSAAQLQAITAG